MVYCAECGSEYREVVASCSDCGSTQFVSEAELRSKGIIPRTEMDTRKFVRAATAEDPLTAERYTQVLEGSDIPVFSRPRRGGTVDLISSGMTHPWWELLVPEEFLTRSIELVTQERARIEAEQPEAEAAAVAEELETESATKLS